MGGCAVAVLRRAQKTLSVMSDDEMLEDQKMEIEALESIYPDEFKIMSEDPYRLSVDILEDDDDGDQIGLRLIAELPPNYPNEPPELGMSIVFTLAGAATEWLQENVVGQPDKEEQWERGKQSFETFSDQVIYDVTEAAASRGTPVTPESFAIWKAAFDKEMGVKVKVAVTTGRQLFESGAVKSTDDAVAGPVDAQEAAPGEANLEGVDLEA